MKIFEGWQAQSGLFGGRASKKEMLSYPNPLMDLSKYNSRAFW